MSCRRPEGHELQRVTGRPRASPRPDPCLPRALRTQPALPRRWSSSLHRHRKCQHRCSASRARAAMDQAAHGARSPAAVMQGASAPTPAGSGDLRLPPPLPDLALGHSRRQQAAPSHPQHASSAATLRAAYDVKRHHKSWISSTNTPVFYCSFSTYMHTYTALTSLALAPSTATASSPATASVQALFRFQFRQVSARVCYM